MILRRYNHYMISLLAWPTLLVTLSLTSIIWLTQALRFIDFIVNRGLSVGSFLYLTALLIPSLLLLIIPIALFIAVVFAYNKLASDSELVVMKAAGLSPLQLAKPAIIIGTLAMLLCYLMSLYLMPLTKRQFKEAQTFLRDNYASVLLQEEVFNTPVDGLTVFIRERGDDGTLHGILVHDNRIPSQTTTMMAEKAQLMQSPTGPQFYLIKGQRQEKRNGQVSWLDFDSYSIDLSFYTTKAKERVLGQEELFVSDLLNPSGVSISRANKYRAEAHQRLTWPLYGLLLPLLAVGMLSRGDFNRRGQWKAISSISAAAIVLVLVIFGLNNFVARTPELAPAIYILALGVGIANLWMLTRTRSIAPSTAQQQFFQQLLANRRNAQTPTSTLTTGNITL
jgi:lipopolysaccharide export system permease protein